MNSTFPIRSLAVLAVLSLTGDLIAAPGPGATNDFGGKRVLILGIDGLRPDSLKAAMEKGMAPQFKELIAKGSVTWNAFAGGPQGTPQQQPTISGPGWASICTGTWIDVHGVTSNKTPPYNLPGTDSSYRVKDAPHFAKRLHEKVPTARVDIISSWGWLETYMVAAQPEEFAYHAKGEGKTYPERDLDVKNKAVAHLAQADPDVLQLHFDQIDGAGHASGFTPENPDYLRAIGEVDTLIGSVLHAIDARPQRKQEQWNIIVTTDHGGTGTKHGGQTENERNIFIITSGPAFAAGVVSPQVIGHAAVPATVFAALNVTTDPAWKWAEPAFGLPIESAPSQ